MGLLDNMDTPEMAFGMGLLGAGGPSMRPVSLGQGLASAYGGAMHAKDRQAHNKRLEQQLIMQQQQAELQKMQMQEIQRKLSEDTDIRNALRSHSVGQPQQPAQPQSAPENQFGGGMSLDPQYAPQRQQPQPSSAKTTQYQRLMGVGDMLTSKGYGDKAQSYYDQAAKLAPKVKDWKQVIVNGKVKYQPLFEDGTSGDPMDNEAATELHFADNGTNTGIGINKFTGAPITQGVKKGYTPGDMVSMRGQNMVDARSREQNAESMALRRDTMMQGNKPPAGYRQTQDGNLEAIPGGPADLKAQALAGNKAAGASDVDLAISSLRDAYDRLDEGGGITSTGKNALQNTGAYLSSSGAGQVVGKMLGTNNQSARNDIAMTRPALLAALMKATGMSAKQMDSNAELKLWLSTATDPTLDVESNRRALAKIEKKYLPGGTGDTPKPPAAPNARPKFGTVQGGYMFMGGDPANPASWKKAQP